jgi:hypothetical protein
MILLELNFSFQPPRQPHSHRLARAIVATNVFDFRLMDFGALEYRGADIS